MEVRFSTAEARGPSLLFGFFFFFFLSPRWAGVMFNMQHIPDYFSLILGQWQKIMLYKRKTDTSTSVTARPVEESGVREDKCPRGCLGFFGFPGVISINSN